MAVYGAPQGTWERKKNEDELLRKVTWDLAKVNRFFSPPPMSLAGLCCCHMQIRTKDCYKNEEKKPNFVSSLEYLTLKLKRNVFLQGT